MVLMISFLSIGLQFRKAQLIKFVSIDVKLKTVFSCYQESAQILYRRRLIHHNRPKNEIHLIKIAELTGLWDADEVNLKNTVEKNILEPLTEHGYIQTYSVTDGLSWRKMLYHYKNERNPMTTPEPCIGKTRIGGR